MTEGGRGRLDVVLVGHVRSLSVSVPIIPPKGQQRGRQLWEDAWTVGSTPQLSELTLVTGHMRWCW